DILAPRQLGVKAGADLQQACHPAPDDDAAGARVGDAREDLEERRLAGAVAADDAHHLAALDLERHVLQRPELLHLVACERRTSAQQIGGGASKAAGAPGNHVPERRVALRFGLVADQVFLAEALGADDDVGHARAWRANRTLPMSAHLRSSATT